MLVEHRDLLPHIAMLIEIADRIGDVPIEVLRELVDQSYAFVAHHLIPHAIAEDEVLYPVVARIMGTPEATRTMSRDHTEIVRLTEELGMLRNHLAAVTPGDRQAKALRRVLYSLHALVSIHFAKEEEIYVPLLEARLSEEEAADVFARMKGAEEAARTRELVHAQPGDRRDFGRH